MGDPVAGPAPPSRRRGRWLVAATLLVAATSINPLTLEHAIFRPGETLDSWRWVATLWLVSIGALGGALAALRDRHVSAGEAARHSHRRLFVGIAAAIPVVFVLAVGELACRLFLGLSGVLPTESDLWWELRWRAQHVSPADGLAASNALAAHGSLDGGSLLDEYHPTLGWSPRPNAKTEGVSINAAGFRALREYSLDRPPGVTRIVVIGDSFAFGEGVSDDDTLCGHLRRLLPDAEVLNFGVHGYGVDQQYLRLKLVAARFHPNVVLHVLFLPDAERNVLSFRDYAKPRFVLRDGRLDLTGVPVPRPQELLAVPVPRERLPASYLAALVQGEAARVWNKTRFSDPEMLTLLPPLLGAMLGEANSVDAAYVLTTLPPGFGSGASLERVTLAWAETRRVPVVDFAQRVRAMSAADRATLFLEDGSGHYSGHGYSVVAQAIEQKLRELQMVTTMGAGSGYVFHSGRTSHASLPNMSWRAHSIASGFVSQAMTK